MKPKRAQKPTMVKLERIYRKLQEAAVPARIEDGKPVYDLIIFGTEEEIAETQKRLKAGL